MIIFNSHSRTFYTTFNIAESRSSLYSRPRSSYEFLRALRLELRLSYDRPISNLAYWTANEEQNPVALSKLANSVQFQKFDVSKAVIKVCGSILFLNRFELQMQILLVPIWTKMYCQRAPHSWKSSADITSG